MQTPQRQVAVKCTADVLLQGKYVKEEGWTPNYIETSVGNVSRAHVVGIVVSVLSDQEFFLDDGTAKLMVRAFNNDIPTPAVGELIRCIGRPREYQSNRYMIPEIIKPVQNPAWAKLHRLECLKPGAIITNKQDVPAKVGSIVEEQKVEERPVQFTTNVVKEIPVKSEVKEKESINPLSQKQEIGSESTIIKPEPKIANQDPHTIIYTLVKSLDEGTGADYEKVIATSSLANGEAIIESLMREGEIFLVAPGKLKVLE